MFNQVEIKVAVISVGFRLEEPPTALPQKDQSVYTVSISVTALKIGKCFCSESFRARRILHPVAASQTLTNLCGLTALPASRTQWFMPKKRPSSCSDISPRYWGGPLVKSSLLSWISGQFSTIISGVDGTGRIQGNTTPSNGRTRPTGKS